MLDKPNPAAGDRGAGKVDFNSGRIDLAAIYRLCDAKKQASPLRAELVGSDTCSITAGITARGSAPVLALCRKLIESGVAPGRPLHVYRGDTLALHVRAIGEAAALEINGRGAGFKRAVPVGTAPPVRLPAKVAP